MHSSTVIEEHRRSTMSNLSQPATDTQCPYVPLSDIDWTFPEHINLSANCVDLPWNRTVYSLTAAFSAATFCIILELILRLFLRFQKKLTLYFWSMVISSLGTITNAAFIIVNYVGHTPKLSLALAIVGWMPMVTGFSLVLYSRLHLVVSSRRLLRVLLFCIVVEGVLFHPPVFVALAYLGPHRRSILRITTSFQVVFSVQEVGLTSLYLYQFYRFTDDILSRSETKPIFALLVTAEVIVLCTDIISIVLLYMEYYLPRTILQPFFYAMKLKIEFILLDMLLQYSQKEQKRCLDALELRTEKTFSNSVSDTTPANPPWNDFEKFAQSQSQFAKEQRSLQLVIPTPSTERSSCLDDIVVEKVNSPELSGRSADLHATSAAPEALGPQTFGASSFVFEDNEPPAYPSPRVRDLQIS